MKIPLTFARGVALHLGFEAAIVFAALLSASLPAGAESGETAQAPKEFRTAIIYDDLFLEHDTGPRFPEHPERLRGLIPHLKQHPVGGRLLWTAPGEKIDPMPWILSVHDAAYVADLKKACEAGETRMQGSSDTPISKRTYEVAVGAVPGSLTAVDLVMEGRVKNAFAALRPPGHHAMPDKAKGFCFFSNAAIAARYARKHHKLERVMIVSLLEGGYSERAMTEAVRRHVEALESLEAPAGKP